MTYELAFNVTDADGDEWSFGVEYARYDYEQSRHAYDWTVTLNDTVLDTSVGDWDSKLRCGVSGPCDTPEPLCRMLGTLFSFLSAWAEAWESVDRGNDSENTDLFSLTLRPLLYAFSSDELSIFWYDIKGER